MLHRVSFPGSTGSKAFYLQWRDLGSIPGEGGGIPQNKGLNGTFWASLVAQRVKHLPAMWET